MTGLLAAYFVLMQFMLMGRAVWIERVFGLDKLAHVHKLNGYLSFLFIIAHPVLLSLAYGLSADVGFFYQLWDFIVNYEDIGAASVATVLFIMVVVLSIHIVRRKLRYEFWYFVHLFTYLAVALAFGHQLKHGGDFMSNQIFTAYWYILYILVFGNVLIFRFLKPLYCFFIHGFAISNIIQETDDVTSLTISGKHLDRFHIKPGQFMILRFFAKGFWWQAHPFSLSCMPNGFQLRVSIKKLGDFTSKISTLKPGTRVLIDGPYGVFTPQNYKAKFLFLAGGIGITPIRSILESIPAHNNVILLYSNKSSNAIVFKKELDELAQKNKFSFHYIISDEPEYQGERGRIDKEKLQRLVKDVNQREIYLCGPAPMMEALVSLLSECGVQPAQIHYEKFAL